MEQIKDWSLACTEGEQEFFGGLDDKVVPGGGHPGGQELLNLGGRTTRRGKNDVHRLCPHGPEIPKRPLRGKLEKSEVLLRLLQFDVPHQHVPPGSGLDAGQPDPFVFLNFLQKERTAEQDKHQSGKDQPPMVLDRLESGFDFSLHEDDDRPCKLLLLGRSTRAN